MGARDRVRLETGDHSWGGLHGGLPRWPRGRNCSLSIHMSRLFTFGNEEEETRLVTLITALVWGGRECGSLQ